MGQFSIWHMIILFVIVLIIFGPKNLPKVGQALGRGIREFKDAARGLSTELEEDERRSTSTREYEAQPPTPPAAPTDAVARTGDSGPPPA
jgi:sec-independent protein translocase protein TatA